MPLPAAVAVHGSAPVDGSATHRRVLVVLVINYGRGVVMLLVCAVCQLNEVTERLHDACGHRLPWCQLVNRGVHEEPFNVTPVGDKRDKER